MPWIYNEDAALKLKLQNLKVIDATAPSGRTVPVRFRLPEDELAALTYPIIIIEHMPFSFAPERQSRGYNRIPYAPEGFAQWWPQNALNFNPDLSPYLSYWPIAVNLDYKVTVYCRKMAGHLQPLMTQLALEAYLPFQMGYLNIPQDGSIRNMFLMQGPTIEYGKDNDDKRLFRASYMVRVMSEVINKVDVNGIFNSIVTDINLNLSDYASVNPISGNQLAFNKAIISTGYGMSFSEGGSVLPGLGEGHAGPEQGETIGRRRPTRGTYTR